MSTFISHPNLPENKITLAAVGNYPKIISSLQSMGIRTLSLESSILSTEVSRHQDILMCHTGENRIFLSPEINPEALENEGFTVITGEKIEKDYPRDVKLNVAVSRDFFICNPKTADASLINELKNSGKREIHTNQGYTKCSVCFITENALITEDPSIYEALRGTDIAALFISKGDIYLSDEHYGFFGGSTGKIDKHTLAVTGELKYHKDGEKIKDFCKSHGIEILELTKGKITDIGGILPLKS